MYVTKHKLSANRDEGNKTILCHAGLQPQLELSKALIMYNPQQHQFELYCHEQKCSESSTSKQPTTTKQL